MLIETAPVQDRYALKISDDIALIHDVSVHAGKTRAMAKGLFLCCQGRLCAGESAGIGLPVWKIRCQTFFPSLESVRAINANAIEKVFRMDRALVWYVAGKRAPAWFSRLLERLVDVFMRLPSLQYRLLSLRDLVMKHLSLQSVMEQGPMVGICRVVYEAEPQGLAIKVTGSSIMGAGQLIMLNEVDGMTFDRLRIGEQVVQAGDIPAWKETLPDTRLESTVLDIGLSLAPLTGDSPSSYRVFCGRELAHGLDWSGLAIMPVKKDCTYHLHFPSLERN